MRFNLRDKEETLDVTLGLTLRRQEKKVIGLTSGCFDLIHFHHAHYFECCRRHCDVLIVGVDSDEMVRDEKGPTRPFIFDYKRMYMVDRMKDVAYAFIMHGLKDLETAAKLFMPDVLIRNSAFAGREHEVVGRQHAGKIVIVHDVEDYSSTTATAKAVAERLARSA